MINKSFITRMLAGVAVATTLVTATLPLSASAWKVNYGADSKCKDNTAVVNWTFTNTEPKGAQWAMNVEFSDAQTGGKTMKTVNPGETVSGTFTSSKTKLNSGSVTIKMLWTDGRSGVDTRTTGYQATQECYVKPFVEPTFTAKTVCTLKDGKAVYTLNVAQTAGDPKLTFTPANGAVLPNGEAVTVTGSYTKDGATKSITSKTEKVSDCTPPVTTTPKPTQTLGAGAATELPKTGSGSTIGLIAGITFAAAVVASQLKMRRSVR